MTLQPAWSEDFRPDRLGQVPSLSSTISRDWAWGGATGAGITVAVVDSGIDESHPAVGHVEGWAAFYRDDLVAGGIRREDGPHEDPVGHGTACAGLIRAQAPDCRLVSVRVLGERLSGKGNVFAAGLRWAIEAGAQVVNCSLSTSRIDYKSVLHDIADEAFFAGTVLVCAPNNIPGDSLPSTYASVISVAAHRGRDPEGFDANPSAPADFGAPGIDLEVPWRGGGTVVTTGNSFAAPHITGLVARLLSKHPSLTPYEVKTVLRACANNAIPG